MSRKGKKCEPAFEFYIFFIQFFDKKITASLELTYLNLINQSKIQKITLIAH